MIAHTLENVAILTVFQFLVVGVILCTIVALLYLQQELAMRQTFQLIAGSLLIYNAHLLLEIVLYYRNLPLFAISQELSLDHVSHAVESASFVFLALSYLTHWLPPKLGKNYVAFAFLLAIGLGAIPQYIHSRWLQEISSAVHVGSFLNAAILLSATLLCLREGGKKRLFFIIPPVTIAFAQSLRIISELHPSNDMLWLGEHLVSLVGLAVLALIVDKEIQNLQFRFFLRLNLTFIAIASVMILVVAETERGEYLHLAEDRTRNLTEFLRGQMVDLYGRGQRAPEIFDDANVMRRLVSDFSEIPDLRRVRLSIDEFSVEMAYEADMTISTQYRHKKLGPFPARPIEMGIVQTLTPVPISINGSLLGSIELDQGLNLINNRIANQMKILFITFTFSVVIAAALFALTVNRAHRTIQRQFREIDHTHQQLAQAARLATVGELAGAFAHQINNPAGIILTTSDYLQRKISNESSTLNCRKCREDIDVIHRQARRISDTVSGLLTFARYTPLKEHSTDVNKLLEESLLLLAPRFSVQGISVHKILGDGLPLILTDPDRLEEVFVNLLNNAADAMPAGGDVKVRTEVAGPDAKYLRISIADTGCGIREEHLKNIFDPFFSTKPKGKGTGLGLPISYRIIHGHGGQINVESKDSRGTVFHIDLPTRRKHAERA